MRCVRRLNLTVVLHASGERGIEMRCGHERRRSILLRVFFRTTNRGRYRGRCISDNPLGAMSRLLGGRTRSPTWPAAGIC